MKPAIEWWRYEPGKELPPGMKLWPDEHGCQPRDMSWGYVDTPDGRVHVQANDWIVKTLRGYWVCKPAGLPEWMVT